MSLVCSCENSILFYKPKLMKYSKLKAPQIRNFKNTKILTLIV